MLPSRTTDGISAVGGEVWSGSRRLILSGDIAFVTGRSKNKYKHLMRVEGSEASQSSWMICEFCERARAFRDNSKFQPCCPSSIDVAVADACGVSMSDECLLSRIGLDLEFRNCRMDNEASSACLLLALWRTSDTNNLAKVNANGNKSGNRSICGERGGRGEFGFDSEVFESAIEIPSEDCSLGRASNPIEKVGVDG